MSIPNIVVVGGGAGGLELVTRLGDSLGRRGRASVTLVERGRTHFWKPHLHELAAGTMDLDVHELGGHDDEVAGDLQIEFLHEMKVLQELLRDAGDRDIVDVELVPFDEEQEEIERSLKFREFDAVHAGLFRQAMVVKCPTNITDSPERYKGGPFIRAS